MTQIPDKKQLRGGRIYLGFWLERVVSIMVRKVQQVLHQWEYMARTPHVSVSQESEKDASIQLTFSFSLFIEPRTEAHEKLSLTIWIHLISSINPL